MRRRGRPAMDDTALLERAAARLASGQAKTPRSAISQTVGLDGAAVRRLQRKWHTVANDRGTTPMKLTDEQQKVVERLLSRHRDAMEALNRLEIEWHNLHRRLDSIGKESSSWRQQAKECADEYQTITGRELWPSLRGGSR